MKNKRQLGERPDVLIDSIDYEIIALVSEKEKTVTELSNDLDIQHKTLKPHLDKLVKANFMVQRPVPKSRKIFYSMEYTYLSPSEVKSMLKAFERALRNFNIKKG